MRIYTKILFILFVAGGASIRTAPADNAASRGPRAVEVAQIVANIVEIHPDGDKFAKQPEFSALARALEASADKLDLADYIIKLHKLFSLLHDGHTAVLSLGLQEEPFTLRTPILVQGFADGIYVVEAKDEAIALLGARITRVNSVPIEQILAAYVSGAQGDNPAFAMRWAPFLFAFPGWLHGLGFATGPYDTPITLEVVQQSGERLSARLQPREGANIGRTALQRIPSRVEAMAAAAKNPNFVQILRDEKALYISLDVMDDTDTQTFSEFTQQARSALAEPVVERVIIDLRRNGGGNNMLPEPLRRTLVRSRFNRPGGIFVLTSPRTFSAAMNLATRLERETAALFVGEPTGGRPNHYGDAKFLRGSATGVEYLVSTLRWIDSTPFDDRIWLLPDLPAPPTFADFVAGRDTALETALFHRDTRDVADDALIASPWARPSQKAGWQFFFEPGSGGQSGPAVESTLPE